jgi:predicted ester cyclase
MATVDRTAELNKAFVSSYFAELSGAAKPEARMRDFTSDESLIEHVRVFEAAFPNYKLLIDDMIAEGDKVVVRARMQAVHKGEFAGIAPTGKSVETTAIIIYQIAQEKVVKFWLQADVMGLIEQLKE